MPDILQNISKLATEPFYDSTSSLAGRSAVVTGASSGVGRAIALALARRGMQLCLVGRDPSRLAEAVATARPFSEVTGFQIDLAVEEDFQPLFRHLEKESGRLDVLIHSAGSIHLDPMERSSIQDLDIQY